MKFKGNLKTKRTQKITSKEPTNIFDFNRPSKVIDFNKLIKTSPIPSSQPLKIIDFNKMILTQNKNKSFEINEIKNPVKRKKMNKVKFVNFDEILFKNVEKGLDGKGVVDGKEVGSKEEDKVEGDKGIKKDTKVDVKDKVEGDKKEKDIKVDTKKTEDKDEIKVDSPTLTINPLPPIALPISQHLPISQPPIPQPIRNHNPIRNHKNFVNRVLSSLEEGFSITDLIKIYIKEKKRTSKSLYLHNLGEKIDKNSILIEDIDLNKEIERLDKQIENIENQDKLWKKIRETSFKDNSFYYKNEENKDNNLFCISKNQIDLKIKEKINKLNFIKESLNLNVKKIKSKVQEEEEKIFKLTENENKMDTMVLLKAITRS